MNSKMRDYVQDTNIVSCSGSAVSDELVLYVDSEGSDSLKKVGEIDDYAMIQSYRSDTDLNKILDLLDIDYFSEFKIDTNAEVVDLTRIPRSLGGWRNYIHTLENYWDSLSPNVRSEIGSIYNLPDFLKIAMEKKNENSVINNGDTGDNSNVTKGEVDE